MYMEHVDDGRRSREENDADESPGKSDVEVIYGTTVITQQHDDSKHDYTSSLDPAFLRVIEVAISKQKYN